MKIIAAIWRALCHSTWRAPALLALVLATSTANAIRDASIASYISAPHPGTSVIMRGGMFAFAGGVIPRGDVVFLDESGRRVSYSDLELVADPSTGRTAVKWGNDKYDLLIQKSLACPLARYVNRGTVIAFTLTVVADDPDYLKGQGLLEAGEGIYVARELSEHIELLAAIDLSRGVRPIEDADVKNKILGSMNAMVRNSANALSAVGVLGAPGNGTYVNADFNVMYQAHLARRSDRRFIDFAGLPLRYYWRIGEDGKTPVFEEVETFSFPTPDDRKQVLQVTFFQNAALMRRFKMQDRTKFANYTTTVCAAR